ncbi:hypothetical protein ACIBIZ_52095 [Nonomuraea spiralis]|uniref:hypothetical protein n=1 Tax=Nonomuraea spiralis TaxID=46182 RepID=UPI00379B8B9E
MAGEERAGRVHRVPIQGIGQREVIGAELAAQIGPEPGQSAVRQRRQRRGERLGDHGGVGGQVGASHRARWRFGLHQAPGAGLLEQRLYLSQHGEGGGRQHLVPVTWRLGMPDQPQRRAALGGQIHQPGQHRPPQQMGPQHHDLADAVGVGPGGDLPPRLRWVLSFRVGAHVLAQGG